MRKLCISCALALCAFSAFAASKDEKINAAKHGNKTEHAAKQSGKKQQGKMVKAPDNKKNWKEQLHKHIDHIENMLEDMREELDQIHADAPSAKKHASNAKNHKNNMNNNA